MTRLILIRHGETNWNVERRKQGRNDQPLNEKGSTQAKLAAEYVKANFKKSGHPHYNAAPTPRHYSTCQSKPPITY